MSSSKLIRLNRWLFRSNKKPSLESVIGHIVAHQRSNGDFRRVKIISNDGVDYFVYLDEQGIDLAVHGSKDLVKVIGRKEKHGDQMWIHVSHFQILPDKFQMGEKFTTEWEIDELDQNNQNMLSEVQGENLNSTAKNRVFNKNNRHLQTR